jgi:hypothetical protein
MDWTDWGHVLSQVNRSDAPGLVDYRRLAEQPGPLDRLMARLAACGPRCAPASFPRPADRLAYAVNTYNATILRSVREAVRDGTVPAYAPFDLETRYAFHIDGRIVRPADLRREALLLAGGDWRVRLALCSGRLIGPPLPRRVLLGELIHGQLDEITRGAFASPNVIAIDHLEARRLLAWRGLYDLKDTLVSDFERRTGSAGASLLNVLLEWSDRPRREFLNTAVGYTLGVLPDDGRLNAFQPAAPEDRPGVFTRLRSMSLIRPGG